MQLPDAGGMNYWQFVGERVATIKELPPKCRQLHVIGYALTVPIYPTIYTLIGLFPDSILARHTQPDALIPKQIRWFDLPNTWWSLVEATSWKAWVTPHLPSIMPECNLPAPENASTIRDK